MPVDIEGMIAEAMREQGQALRERMDNLLGPRQVFKIVELWPGHEVEIVTDPAMPKDRIGIAQYGVMMGYINIK
jgi:hypothetical protein